MKKTFDLSFWCSLVVFSVDISQYVKSGAPLEFVSDEDIKSMWDNAIKNAEAKNNS